VRNEPVIFLASVQHHLKRPETQRKQPDADVVDAD
jgi:hypothetical protein